MKDLFGNEVKWYEPGQCLINHKLSDEIKNRVYISDDNYKESIKSYLLLAIDNLKYDDFEKSMICIGRAYMESKRFIDKDNEILKDKLP